MSSLCFVPIHGSLFWSDDYTFFLRSVCQVHQVSQCIFANLEQTDSWFIFLALWWVLVRAHPVWSLDTMHDAPYLGIFSVNNCSLLFSFLKFCSLYRKYSLSKTLEWISVMTLHLFSKLCSARSGIGKKFTKKFSTV